MSPAMRTPTRDHAARLAAGAACLDAALTVYRPRGLVPTCCCDPNHIGVGKKHAQSCTNPGKAPMHKWKAWQTRIPTREEVQALWRDYPLGNVGALLGQVSGLVRVDVDGREGEALLQQWSAGDLPPAGVFAAPLQDGDCSTPGRRIAPVTVPPRPNTGSTRSCACRATAHKRCCLRVAMSVAVCIRGTLAVAPWIWIWPLRRRG
jgi:hypothetical protein